MNTKPTIDLPVRGAGVLWYLPGLKRAVAGTPVATKDFIEMLAGDSPDATVQQTHDAINFDSDAQAVLRVYVDHGYGAESISDLLANRVPRRK